MSLGIACAWLHDHKRYKFCFTCVTGHFTSGYLTVVHHLPFKVPSEFKCLPSSSTGVLFEGKKRLL